MTPAGRAALDAAIEGVNLFETDGSLSAELAGWRCFDLIWNHGEELRALDGGWRPTPPQMAAMAKAFGSAYYANWEGTEDQLDAITEAMHAAVKIALPSPPCEE